MHNTFQVILTNLEINNSCFHGHLAFHSLSCFIHVNFQQFVMKRVRMREVVLCKLLKDIDMVYRIYLFQI
jgi:hypothetical protein